MSNKMNRVALILCLVTRVNMATKVQRHIYSHVSKHSRSNYPPSQNDYVSLTQKPNVYDINYSSKYTDTGYKDPTNSKIAEKLQKTRNYLDNPYTNTLTVETLPYQVTPYHDHSTHYEISRMKARNSYANGLPSYMSSDIADIMIAKLKPNYHSASSRTIKNPYYDYEIHSDFHNDDEDVRSSGKTMYDYYSPYIYQLPNEYDHNKTNFANKGKDKRYIESYRKVIPVHEDIDDVVTSPPKYVRETNALTTDNPVNGNGPFFSFVLNDYFDKNPDDDTLSFKGLGAEWGKDFDHESYIPRSEDSNRFRKPRLDEIINGLDEYKKDSNWPATTTPLPIYKSTISDPIYRVYPDLMEPNKFSVSETQKAGNKDYIIDNLQANDKSNFNKLGKLGSNENSNFNTAYDTGEHSELLAKDFIDSFANKFGAEDYKKESNFKKDENSNKGEKKKGFHRIYHKDEFLQDNEYYDNSNSSSQAADKGNLAAHVGGSEAALRSQAAAAIQNAANAKRELAHNNHGKYINFDKDYHNDGDRNRDLHKYIDIAKQAVYSNNADYMDNFKL